MQREKLMNSALAISPKVISHPNGGHQGKTLTLVVGLIVVYLIMEYARPANPLFIPMAISIVLFAKWVALKDKHWDPQVVCFVVLLASIAVMVPFARNTFSALMDFRGMATELMCIAVPVMHFVNTLPRLALVADCLIGVLCYISIFAILSAGRGPGGHVGDENDVAIALVTFMPLALVSAAMAKTTMRRVLSGCAFLIMAAGVVATMSRGGALGLAAMLSYGFWLSPQKMRTALIALVFVIGAAAFAPGEYWAELASIGYEIENQDMNAGTGALRREYWAIARQMFYSNPLFGVGIGNFKWTAGEYQTERQLEQSERVFTGQECHSLYFQVLSEVGLAGMVLFLLILWFNRRDAKYVNAVLEPLLYKENGLAVKGLWAANKSSGTSRGAEGNGTNQMPKAPEGSTSKAEPDVSKAHDLKHLFYYARAIEAGLIGFCVSGIFLSVFTYPHFWLLTALIVALKRIVQDQIGAVALVGGAYVSPGRQGAFQSAHRLSKHEKSIRGLLN